MSREDIYRQDIIRFLETCTEIGKINFNLKGYKVYPSAYRKDIHDALQNEDIEITIDPDLATSNVAAKYRSNWLFFTDDQIKLSPRFSIRSISDQMAVIH